MTAGCAYLHFSRLRVISSLVQRYHDCAILCKITQCFLFFPTLASLPRLPVNSPEVKKNPFFTPFAFYTVDFVYLKTQL